MPTPFVVPSPASAVLRLSHAHGIGQLDGRALDAFMHRKMRIDNNQFECQVEREREWSDEPAARRTEDGLAAELTFA